MAVLATFPARAQYFHDRYADVGGRQSYLGPAVATDSGFVVSGQVNDYGANQRPAIQLRGLTPDGRTRWLRTYWRAGAAYYGPLIQGLLPIAGGGYAMNGTGVFPDTGGNGTVAIPMLWRFTAQGDTLWTRRYPGAVSASGWGMCATSDGGYVLVGAAFPRRPNGTQYQQAMLLRVDAAGNVVWQRYYGTHDRTWTALVTATPDGGFLVTGDVRTPVLARQSQSYVLKVDAVGVVQWQKFLGDATVLNGAGASVVTRDGNYVVAANAGRPLINDRGRQSLYKFRPDGTQVWHRELGPVRSLPVSGTALELADGSLVVAGSIGREDSLGTNDVRYEAFAYKVCADGDSVWYRTYRLLNGPRSDHYLQGFCAAPNGGFLGTGFLFPYLPDTGTSDGWAFRTDSLGYLIAGGAPPARICPRPTWLGVAPDAGGAGVSVYPNPSASGRYTLGGAGGAQAEVRDALGRLVYRQAVRAGAETALDLSAAPPGLYLLRLRWGAEKTVIIKLVR